MLVDKCFILLLMKAIITRLAPGPLRACRFVMEEDMDLTQKQKVMKYTGLVYAVVFIGTLLIFIALPEQMFSAINAVSAALFPSLPPAADSGKFWVSLSVSMMVTISALSLMIYRDVKANYRMAVPLVAAKFTSSILGLGFFIAGTVCTETGWNTLANILILCTDMPLGVLMLVLYRMVRDERV